MPDLSSKTPHWHRGEQLGSSYAAGIGNQATKGNPSSQVVTFGYRLDCIPRGTNYWKKADSMLQLPNSRLQLPAENHVSATFSNYPGIQELLDTEALKGAT